MSEGHQGKNHSKKKNLHVTPQYPVCGPRATTNLTCVLHAQPRHDCHHLIYPLSPQMSLSASRSLSTNLDRTTCPQISHTKAWVFLYRTVTLIFHHNDRDPVTHKRERRRKRGNENKAREFSLSPFFFLWF